MIKAILFDTYGVILNEDKLYEGFFDSIKKKLKELGINVSDDEFNDAVKQTIFSYVPSLTSALIWHFVKPDVVKCNELVNDVFKHQRKWSNQNPQPLNSGMKEVLKLLSKSYMLALAGNVPSSVRDVLDGHGVLKYFTQTDVSEDIGLWKPDPRFFEHILRKLGVSTQEAIMIGDRLDNDIIPAKLLGMKAILVKTGPYIILEPRTPNEIPDATVSSVRELPTAIDSIVGGEK